MVGQNCFTLPLITQLFLAARPLAGGALALPLGLAAPSRIGKVSKSRQSGLTRPPGLAASNTFLSFAATSVGLLTASGSGLRGGHLYVNLPYPRPLVNPLVLPSCLGTEGQEGPAPDY